jgi:16S rRNA (uracil1498-N3)-methyltransferase
MTRRRFYAPPEAFKPAEQTVVLSEDESRHARDVLRLHPGDEVYVFDGAGKEFRGTVQRLDRRSAVFELGEEVEPARSESPLDLTLAIVLLKGEKFDLVIQKASELGVNRIVPLDSARADVRLRTSEDAGKRLSRWQRIAREATKQSGRARIPDISEPLALESWLSSSSAGLGVMFSERDGQSWSQAFPETKPIERLAVLTGPEGGWEDREIELARNAAFEIITLGGRTLRAETAAIVAVTLAQHRFGDLG